MPVKLTIVNDLKKTTWAKPDYPWFLDVLQGLVSQVSCNGGSSDSTSVEKIEQGIHWNWNSTKPIETGKIYTVDLTVSAPFQQRHTIHNIQVSVGSTLTIIYIIPDRNVPLASYAYKLGSQPPVSIGTAVQGVS